jgi:hypothetical protein
MASLSLLNGCIDGFAIKAWTDYSVALIPVKLPDWANLEIRSIP